ncbi:MAG TPA: glutaredoxin domain-containing protein [Segeticoccus sp.]|nr:glutaredoxin domain-containing protein [Segeticoccus sp.]
MERWSWVLVLAATAYAATSFGRQGQWGLLALVAVAGLPLAWWTSPWRGSPSATHREVLDRPERDRRVVVYWRPGCVYCARLRSLLGHTRGRATWVNIWQDAEAAAFVRSVNGGNETVPTVVLDGVPVTNPDPRHVRGRLVQEEARG